MQAKKQFGQNFLKDPYILDQIVQVSTKILKGQKLIEIGVGLGDLSERLLTISSLTAYEIDADLCSFVLQKFSSCPYQNQFTLLHCDVLSLPFYEQTQDSCIDSHTESIQMQCDITRSKKDKITNTSKRDMQKGWLANEPYILVSNLPYYIATRIVLNLLKDPMCEGFVVMTQKEVALKFCAAVKESGFCALSILAQSVGTTSLLFDVPKEAFYPMPKVTSSVFVHQKQQKKALGITKGFEDMLKIAFCAPRKKLFNNLATHYSRTKLESIFKQQQITQNTRPHEVSTQKYHQIYKHLKGTTNE